MLPSGCHVQERKNLRLHDLQASGEGEEGVTVLLHELNDSWQTNFDFVVTVASDQ